MCGIGGFWGRFSPDLLEEMRAILRHRGPDGSGVYVAEEHGVGLVHTRLSIIDLSDLGRQPMWDMQSKAVIAFNGEIYNYKELREGLRKRGVQFRSESDTEVLLNLYLAHGRQMLTMLNGIYAFAIWDCVRRELFLARDGVGVKPLYFAETANGFIFASELKAVLRDRRIARTINDEAVRSYLTYLWCPAPETMLKSIQKLEPGYALCVRDGRVTERWEFYDMPRRSSAGAPVSAEGVMQRLERRLETAVSRQLVSDVPVGAFLSGGLDSSLVVALARKARPEQRITCFTIDLKDGCGRNDGMTDDLPYAEKAARHLGVDLEKVSIGPNIIHRLEQMIYYLEEPQADLAALSVLTICEQARDRGIKVLLSGAGGDDIFTGYRRHFALISERYWKWMPKGVRRRIRDVVAEMPVGNPLLRRLRKASEYMDLDGDERIASYFFWLHPSTVGSLCRAGDGAQGLAKAIEPLVKTLKRLPQEVSPLNRMLYLEAKHFLADHNLNYTDKMSMAAGVEVRVPFLDPDLIEDARDLPDNYMQRGGTGKWILKKIAENYLPKEIIYRPKTGFGVPLRQWLQQGRQRMVSEFLSRDVVERRGLFDPHAVERLVKMNREGRSDSVYTMLGLICVEMWCRLFLDDQCQQVPARREDACMRAESMT